MPGNLPSLRAMERLCGTAEVTQDFEGTPGSFESSCVTSMAGKRKVNSESAGILGHDPKL